MPFISKSGKSASRICEVTVGTGDRAVTAGGESSLPFYTFDGKTPNRPRTGIEITDGGVADQPAVVQKYYDGCVSAADMARKASSFEGVDFICLALTGADPNGKNRPADELMETVRAVADATDLPLAVSGCDNAQIDAGLLRKAAQVLKGRNALMLSAREENYESVKKTAAPEYGQNIGAESADDINLAKQLNILLLQAEVPENKIIMQPGTAACGYGFEYVISTIDRIRLAALQQSDKTLQMPVITPVAQEAWSVREAAATQDEMPEWGSQEERGIDMEVETAAAVLAAGSDAVILKHPESVRTIAAMTAALTQGGQ